MLEGMIMPWKFILETRHPREPEVYTERRIKRNDDGDERRIFSP